MASKTTTVNISGTVFHMTESSYKIFADYLKSVKKYFAKHEGCDEIIADLESRIAENFSEKISASKQVLLKKDVEELIDIMGQVKDFAAEEEGQSAAEPEVSKRFYRDGDKRILAGVCAGLANYFDVDVRLVRLIFFLSIFLGGIGFLAYGLFWIFVPEAKTGAEKEEMAGYKFDLAAIVEDVEEKVKDIKVPKGASKKVGGFFRALGQGVTWFVKFILKFILFLLRIVTIFAAPALILVMVAFTLVIFALAFDLYPYFIHLPEAIFVNKLSLYAVLGGTYALVMAPLVALLLIFFAPLKKKWLLTASKGVVLISLFLVGALVTGLGAVDLAPRVDRAIEEELESEVKIVQTFDDLKPFETINLYHPVRQATITQGEDYSVQILADERCKGAFEPEVYRQELRIEYKEILPYNFFCDVWGVDVVITAPDFEGFRASRRVKASIGGFDFDELHVHLADRSTLMLAGQAEFLSANLYNYAKLDAFHLQSKTAEIQANGHSEVDIRALNELIVTTSHEAIIRYLYLPKLIVSSKENGDDSSLSRVEKIDLPAVDVLPPPSSFPL